MPEAEVAQDASEQRLRALSRWDNEGGALTPAARSAHADAPDMTNAEMVHLHVRVIALENMLIAVLAEGSDRQLEVAREMAGYISPRPGFTAHTLTIQAADHMTDLVARALHFRNAQSLVSVPKPYKSTPVFDETTLPAGLRREHRTKAGVWGVIRALEGSLRYQVLEPLSETILDPDHPGLVLPDQPHLVEPLGAVRMQVEFYDRSPATSSLQHSAL